LYIIELRSREVKKEERENMRRGRSAVSIRIQGSKVKQILFNFLD
jgi:hypothetical protein